MSSMVGVLGAVYTRPCKTCKPGPDGSTTGLGWTLTIAGVAVLVVGICALILEARTDSESPAPANRPASVMDAVQREDVERRAQQAARRGDIRVGGTLTAFGVIGAVIGLVILAITAGRINEDKTQLRSAAADLVSSAIDGPVACRETPDVTAGWLPSSSASTPYTPSAADCDDSPRHYGSQSGSYTLGLDPSMKYEYSESYETNGEVTVYDPLNKRAVCVTVPDTDVVAAAQASATPSTNGYGIPAFDDRTFDPSPYIKSGACPDAPVTGIR